MQIILREDARQQLKDFSRNGKLIAYGCSLPGFQLIKEFVGLDDISYIVDDDPNKKDKLFMDKPVFGQRKLMEESRESTTIIVASIYYPEIKQAIENLGFNKYYSLYDFFHIERCADNVGNNTNEISSNTKKIKKAIDLMSDERSKYILDKVIEQRSKATFGGGYTAIGEPCQYFPKIILEKLTDNEVFLDIGVFDGFTTQIFIKNVDNKFSKIIGFEADRINFKKLETKEKFLKDDRIEFYPYAVYSDNTEVFFYESDMRSNSKIVYENEGIKVKAIKLDDFIKGSVTFIKMDIEGGEMGAIMGAKELIKRCKPMLAISIYHSTSDLWEIPLLINSIVPEYKLYVKHHSITEGETVLYAIP